MLYLKEDKKTKEQNTIKTNEKQRNQGCKGEDSAFPLCRQTDAGKNTRGNHLDQPVTEFVRIRTECLCTCVVPAPLPSDTSPHPPPPSPARLPAYRRAHLFVITPPPLHHHSPPHPQLPLSQPLTPLPLSERVS